MHFQALAFIGIVLFSSAVSSAPIPSFEDIEKRWHQGESEKQIHADIDIRSATPAWPIERSTAQLRDTFSHAFDSRTLHTRMQDRRAAAGVLGAAERLLFGHVSRTDEIDWRWNEDESPVLKPRRTIKWNFDK